MRSNLFMLSFIISILKTDSSSCSIYNNLFGSFKVKLNRNGFHRHLEMQLTIKDKLKSSSPNSLLNGTVTLRQKFPSGLYVDPYEIEKHCNSLQKFSLEDDINVELPEYQSAPFQLEILTPLINGVLLINYPFHIRYHRPHYCHKENYYLNISLERPQVYLKIQENSDECSQHKLRCDFDTLRSCSWINIETEKFDEALTAEVPVACFEHYYLVLIVTVFVTVFGCLTILRTLIKNEKSRKKD